MKKRWMLWILVSLMSVTAVLSGCAGRKKHEAEVVPNVVRIYDVESQDRSRMSNSSYEDYLKRQEEYEMCNDPERKVILEKSIAGYNEVKFNQHEYRLGIFTGVGKYTNQTPFSGMISQVEKETGIEIEFVLKDNWEEVREDIEKNRGDGITKIVLFNNSYDRSLLQEAASGNYINMEEALEDVGLYDEELYHQAVIDAGRVNGGQYLVPLLYDVSGMIKGARITEENQIIITSEEEYEKTSLSYEEFIGKLNEAMEEWEDDVTNIPFLSAGFYENNPDVFLMAAGQNWEDYEEQQELFATLLNYMKLYRNTTSFRNGMTNQELYMMYLEMNERNAYDDALTDGMLEDLQVDFPEEMPLMFAIDLVSRAYMDRTKYLVESTGAEEIPLHSILGLLSYSDYYCPGQGMEYGKMDYYPIGIWGEKNVFAAQPLSYAAVVEGGSGELAAEVILGLLNGKVAGQFGLSPCKAVAEYQIENWLEGGLGPLYVRSIVLGQNLEYILDPQKTSGWGPSGMSGGAISQAVAADQLREQIDNIVTAQIPDREILTIWQDTLTEAVNSELSAEAGFELLCERMDEWYTE